MTLISVPSSVTSTCRFSGMRGDSAVSDGLYAVSGMRQKRLFAVFVWYSVPPQRGNPTASRTPASSRAWPTPVSPDSCTRLYPCASRGFAAADPPLALSLLRSLSPYQTPPARSTVAATVPAVSSVGFRRHRPAAPGPDGAVAGPGPGGGVTGPCPCPCTASHVSCPPPPGQAACAPTCPAPPAGTVPASGPA
ncbi:hypothetical protein LO762_19810 [Actinocorallia sp. API 0066]|nr:hypothetical protein [Actinocorallia sp. API 0066]